MEKVIGRGRGKYKVEGEGIERVEEGGQKGGGGQGKGGDREGKGRVVVETYLGPVDDPGLASFHVESHELNCL